MIPLLAGAALAAGQHAGIPQSAIQGLSDPSYTTPEHGWSGTLPGGWLRVYVGRTEADADRWYEAAVGALTVAPATAGTLGDESAGDPGPDGAFYAFRDGNVAALVRLESGARARAEALHAAIVDDVPWPEAKLVPLPADGPGPSPGWRIDAPWAVAVRGEGAASVPFQPGAWQARPTRVYAWDHYGRAVEIAAEIPAENEE